MRQALGRGLDALIQKQDIETSPEKTIETRRIKIESIRPNHLQPRKSFDPEKLSELAQSIRENGLAQPIIVSFDDKTNSYELIAGERRFRAAQLAGLKEIDVIVRQATNDKDRLALALIENIQREDLNAFDEALAYLRLIKEFSLSQIDISQKTGKSRSAISNTLRLLDLPEEIQKALQTNMISEGHARALLLLKDPIDLIRMFRRVVEYRMSVREVENEARAMQDASATANNKKILKKIDKSADIKMVESSLQHMLGTKVDISVKKNSQKGTIKIHFFNLTDFDRILQKIKK